MVFSGRPPWWQALRKTGRVVTLVGLALLGSALVPSVALAKGEAPGTVALSQLPAEAQATQRLIQAAGPFAHGKDGSVFGNREHALPARPRGFYREYTVRTPGARDRGARRIVCGGNPPTRPQTCYYTGDHYTTFRQIVP